MLPQHFLENALSFSKQAGSSLLDAHAARKTARLMDFCSPLYRAFGSAFCSASTARPVLVLWSVFDTRFLALWHSSSTISTSPSEACTSHSAICQTLQGGSGGGGGVGRRGSTIPGARNQPRAAATKLYEAGLCAAGASCHRPCSPRSEVT